MDEACVSSSSFFHLNKDELLQQTINFAEKIRYLQHSLNNLQNDKLFLIKECDMLRSREVELLNIVTKTQSKEHLSNIHTPNSFYTVEKEGVEDTSSLTSIERSDEDNNSSNKETDQINTINNICKISEFELNDPNLQEIFDIIIEFKKNHNKFPSKAHFFDTGVTRYYLNKYGNVRGIRKLFYNHHNN